MENKNHILILMNGWSGKSISGGDQHVLDLCEIIKKKNSVCLMLPKLGRDYVESESRAQVEGVRFIDLPDLAGSESINSSVLLVINYFLRSVMACFKSFSCSEAAVVISASHFLYDVLPAVVYKFCHRAKITVYVYHVVGEQKRKETLRNLTAVFFENLSLFLIKKFFDLVVTDNQITHKELLDLGVLSKRIVLSNLCVRRPDPSWLTAPKAYDLVYMGRISRLKGSYDLIEVVKNLQSDKGAVVLTMIGGGDEVESVKSAVESCGLSQNFKFMGFLTGGVKYKALSQGRIFVFPSYEEGWGIALAEAMSLGLPCVTYDLPAVRSVFGEGPIYSPVGDSKNMASQVMRLLADPLYYGGRAKQSLKAVENYYLDSSKFKEFEVLGIKI